MTIPRSESDPEAWPHGRDDLDGGDYPIDPEGYDPDALDRDETRVLSDDAALIDYAEDVFLPQYERDLDDLQDQLEWEAMRSDPTPTSRLLSEQAYDSASTRGAEVVVAVWEQLQGALLGARRSAFLAREETAALAVCPRDVLTVAARMVMNDNPRGHLLLGAWLAATRREP